MKSSDCEFSKMGARAWTRFALGIALIMITTLPVFVLAQKAIDKGSAEIRQMKGKIVVQKKGTDEWVVGKPGMVLHDGDKIQTSGGSTVILGRSDGFRMKIMPMSVVTISFDNRREPTKLGEGNIFIRESTAAQAEKLSWDDTFKVETPTAYAGVRGTFFSTEADTEETTVDVFDGAVEVRSVTAPEEQGVVVNPHMRTTVQAGKQPESPKEIPEEEEKQMIETYAEPVSASVKYDIGVSLKPVKKGQVKVNIAVTADGAEPGSPVKVSLKINGDAIFEASNEKKLTIVTDAKGNAETLAAYTGKFSIDATVKTEE